MCHQTEFDKEKKNLNVSYLMPNLQEGPDEFTFGVGLFHKI